MRTHAVPDAGVVINDPGTVATLEDARPVDLRVLMVGGKSGAMGAEPLPLEAEVV